VVAHFERVISDQLTEVTELEKKAIELYEADPTTIDHSMEQVNSVNTEKHLGELIKFVDSLLGSSKSRIPDKTTIAKQSTSFSALKLKLDSFLEETEKQRVEMSQVEAAEQELEEAEKEFSQEKAQCLEKLGIILIEIGKYQKSEEYCLKSVKIREAVLDPQHPELAQSYNNLGRVNWHMGKYQKSEEYYLKSVKIREAVLDPQHPELAQSYSDLGLLYWSKKDYEQAENFHLKSLKIRKNVLEPQHPDLAKSYNNLGVLYKTVGKHLKATSTP